MFGISEIFILRVPANTCCSFSMDYSVKKVKK